MSKEVVQRRIFEYIKQLQANAWPGESNDQVVERLVAFACTDRDTEDFVPIIKEFFPRFLGQRNGTCPAVSEARRWVPGLVLELMSADDDDDEALLIVFLAIYYYCMDPKLTCFCGYDYGMSGTLAGHFLRCENHSIRDLIHEIVKEMMWFIPSYSLFPVCVVHSVIETEQPGCVRTINLLQEICSGMLAKDKWTRGFDVKIGMEDFSLNLKTDMENFSFDLWWRCMHSVLPLHGYKMQVQTAVDSLIKDLQDWFTEK